MQARSSKTTRRGRREGWWRWWWWGIEMERGGFGGRRVVEESAGVATGSAELDDDGFAVNLLAVHVLQCLGSVSGVEELDESLVLFPWGISQFLYGTYPLIQPTTKTKSKKGSESGDTKSPRQRHLNPIIIIYSFITQVNKLVHNRYNNNNKEEKLREKGLQRRYRKGGRVDGGGRWRGGGPG